MRHIRSTLLIATLSLLSALGAAAQEAYPNKVVRLVVPFAAGGGTDLLARILAERLGAVWRQTVIVDNRPGVSGILGSDIVAKSKNDGYTILLATASTHGVAPGLRPSLPYNVERDFVAITEVATSSMVLLVHTSVPVKSLGEFVEYAKAKPGQIPYDGTPGTAAHMAMELLSARAGMKLQPIGYRGSSPALIDLAAGQLNVSFNDVPPAIPFIRDGKLRAIAVTSPKRVQLLPDVPTVAESGFQGFDADVWYGLFAPASTPPEIVRKISSDLRTGLSEPAAKKKLEEGGFTLVASSPSDFSVRVRNDIQKWRKVISDGNIKIE